MDDSFNELIYFPVLPLAEPATGALCTCLVGALPKILRGTIISLVRDEGGEISFQRNPYRHQPGSETPKHMTSTEVHEDTTMITRC